MPTFVEMFEGSGLELPLITRFMLGTSTFLSNNLIIILLAIAIIIVLFNIYKKSPQGIYTISSLKLRLPIIGNLNKKIIVSRFTRTLSTLLSAGVSLVHALPTVAGVLENKVAEDAVIKIRERVVRGDGLSNPIREK